MSDLPPFERLSCEGMRLVNDVCDAFEQEWQSHDDAPEPPSPLDVLSGFECTCSDDFTLVREALCIALIQIDREFRARRELPATRDVYESVLPRELITVLHRIDWSRDLLDFPVRIGPYKIIRRLGRGGMGEVFLAEQSEPIRRQVALKVIKTDTPTKEILGRFDAERQALAMMQHENIAQILDAGEDKATGRPYFAMEYIQGIPITNYCDQNKLNPSERIRLLIQACRGIQHAHAKGVMHRDIKPTNVLVTDHEGDLVAKVIDFGLAKAVHNTTRLSDRTIHTQHGFPIGTLAYMSPEQAHLNALDVDTRTDVYSLGAILYELLTGSTPIQKARLESEPFDRILALIREEDTPRPSQRLSRSGEFIAAISHDRRIDPNRLGSVLKRDLDWIAIKALEKDRARRYETPSALADDLCRFLDDEPVQAKPPSRSYRLAKTLRRNKKPVLAGVIVAGLLLPLLVTSAWSWVVESRAKARAVEVNQLVESINGILDASELSMEGIRRAELMVQQISRSDNDRANSENTRLVAAVVNAAKHALETQRVDKSIQNDVLAKARWLRKINSFASDEVEARLGERLSKWHTLADADDVAKLHPDGLLLKQDSSGLVSQMKTRAIGRGRAKIVDRLPRSFRAKVKLDLKGEAVDPNAAVIVPRTGGDLEFRLASRVSRSFGTESIDLPITDRRRSACWVKDAWETKVSGGLGVRKSVAISHNGELLAVPDGRANIAILDANSGERVQSVQVLNDAGFAVAFADSSPDLGDRDFQLNLISLAPLRWSSIDAKGVGRTIKLAGEAAQYFDMHAQRELVLAFEGGMLQCIPWKNPQDRKLLRLGSAVRSATFSLDGGQAAVVTQSGDVFLWSLESGNQQLLCQGTKPPSGTTFLSDNRSLLVSVADRTVAFDVSTGVAVKAWQRGAIFGRMRVDTARGLHWHLTGGNSIEVLDAGLRPVGLWHLSPKVFPKQLVLSSDDSVYAIDPSEGRIIAGHISMGEVPNAAKSHSKETVAQILQGGLVLAESTVNVDDQFVQLVCTQDRKGLEFQVNDNHPIQIDTFVLTESDGQTMELCLDEGDVLMDLSLEGRIPPRRASDLERADLAFESRDYGRAADLYGVCSPIDRTVIRECAFKEGLCRLLSGNQTLGKRRLKEVAATGEDRWTRHALTRLWMDALREEDNESAEALAIRLLDQFAFSEVLPLLTQMDRHTIRSWVISRRSKLSTSDLLRHDPNRVARLRKDVQILELLSHDPSDDASRRLLLHQRMSLAKAMEFDGQDRGVRTELKELLDGVLSEPQPDPVMIMWVTEEYSRCLRRLNDVAKARDLVNHVDQQFREMPPGPHLQMMALERARVRVAEGRLSAAAAGLEVMLRLKSINHHARLSAHLMRGAVLARMGETRAAKTAFSEASHYVQELLEIREDSQWSAGDRFRALLILVRAEKLTPEVLMSSLTGLLSRRKSSADILLSGITAFVSSEELAHAFIRSWELNERDEFWLLATDATSELDRYRIPLVRFAQELANAKFFSGEANIAEQNQLHRLMEEGFESAIRKGEVGLSLATAVSLALKTPQWGWKMLQGALPQNESLSSKICYVMAIRFSQIGFPVEAREAARKAATLTNDEELRRLAESLLAKIDE